VEITRCSMVSGITRTKELPVTDEQFQKYLQGACIQDAFPNLSKADREFIKTGITDEEWEELFREVR
jgi:hypothetical protein